MELILGRGGGRGGDVLTLLSEWDIGTHHVGCCMLAGFDVNPVRVITPPALEEAGVESRNDGKRLPDGTDRD